MSVRMQVVTVEDFTALATAIGHERGTHRERDPLVGQNKVEKSTNNQETTLPRFFTYVLTLLAKVVRPSPTVLA